MSGQWEVVGKKKDKNIKQLPQKGGNTKENKPKIIVKVEDVLPQSQIKHLFGAKNGKDVQKPQEKSKKVENNQQKKPPKKQEKQEPAAPKPKPPKSIESALNSISIEDFRNVYESTKAQFINLPLVWLKELAQFLNQKIPVEVDPVFKNKADSYPFSALSSQLRNVMETALKEAGKDNIQIFFDICLSTIATDMSKGLPCLGHKLFVQLLARTSPKIVMSSPAKYSGLLASYQNRQNVGLSILWALGQGGMKDFNVGLKVFEEFMYPLIEMKNYSRYAVTYLINLINRFNDVSLTKEQYQFILELIYSNKKNFPNDLSQSLQETTSKLKLLLFTGNNDKYHTFVEFFLRKLTVVDHKDYRKELCDVIMTCLQKDATIFSTWSKNYTKYLVASGILLNYIDENWKRLYRNFSRKTFSDLLNTYSVTNDELLLKKRKDDGLTDAVAAIEKIRNKMARKKSGGFPVKTLVFLVAVATGTAVILDVRRSGNWESSSTYKTMKEAGVNDYVYKASNRAVEGFVWVRERFDEKFPGYSDKAVEVSQPYVKLTKDMSLFFYNVLDGFKDLALEKYPIVLESIERYAPGLMEQSSKTVQHVWSTSVSYFNNGVDYLKTEVFVGQLAPENMQRLVIDALNSTQQKASEYYSWLYEKVQSTIK